MLLLLKKVIEIENKNARYCEKNLPIIFVSLITTPHRMPPSIAVSVSLLFPSVIFRVKLILFFIHALNNAHFPTFENLLLFPFINQETKNLPFKFKPPYHTYSSSLFQFFKLTHKTKVVDKMPEIQLGAHTVRSHGVTVARTHMHDWLILMLLVVIEVVLNVIEPFHRFVGKDMLTDLSYPLKENTVPFWAVPLVAIVLPFAVITIYYFIRRDVYDLHHAILGLLYSVLITGVITDAIKDAVGRPRPDFFWRCFPDGKGVFDPVTTDVMCTGLKSVIKEGHKSFPSGHTSWSFAGLGFLALYLSGKIRAFDRRGHVAKLCIVFLPLLVAALVGISRVDDYWHHWQDVFAGGILGLTVASFCYLQFFPPPYDVDGWGPHAYFQMLADSRNGGGSSNNMNINCFNGQQSELESVFVDSQHRSEVTRIHSRDTSPILEGSEVEMRH